MKARTVRSVESSAGPFVAEILDSKLGAKKKVKAIAEALTRASVDPRECVLAIAHLPETKRGSVLEAFELATRSHPELIDGSTFQLVLGYLSDPGPRVRWEAARTIGNVAAGHPAQLDQAVAALVPNTKHEGTVVRWATAHALTAILRAGHHDASYIARLKKVAAAEPDNGARSVYEKALKQVR